MRPVSDTVQERYEKLDDHGKQRVHEIGRLVLDACAHRDAEWVRVVRDVSAPDPLEGRDSAGVAQSVGLEILKRMGDP